LLREASRSDANTEAAASRKGKTFEELYGERAQEMKRKMRERAVQRGAPVLSDVSRQKISDALKGRERPDISAAKKGKPSARKGKTLSEEHRARISAGHRKSEKAKIARLHKRIHFKPSSLEHIVRSVLEAIGVNYVLHYRVLTFVADIFVPSRNLIIECDGFYWHSRPGAVERDAARDKKMTEAGYTVLRLSEQEIRSEQASVILTQLFGAA
jgi:very-short-patch-repair endonuclease